MSIKSRKSFVKRKERNVLQVKRQNKSHRLRLSVFRSNTSIYLQLIDDSKSHTVLALSSSALKLKKGHTVEAAEKLGVEFAKLATKSKIKNIVFDRGGYKFHGRIKSLAEALRAGGLEF